MLFIFLASYQSIYAQKKQDSICKPKIDFSYWTKERGPIPRYVVGKIKRAKGNFIILIGASTYDVYTVEGYVNNETQLMTAHFIIHRNNGKEEKFELFKDRDLSNQKIKNDSGNNLLDQCYDRLMDLSRRNIFNQRIMKPVGFYIDEKNPGEWTLEVYHLSDKTFIWNIQSRRKRDTKECEAKIKKKVESTKR